MIRASQDAELRAIDINNPRQVDLQRQYAFRFMGKYRINHRWLSGVNVWACHYLRQIEASTPFPEIFGDPPEPRVPLVEHDGQLMRVVVEHGRLEYVGMREYVYGTNSEGRFERYLPICQQGYLSSYNGVGVLIIKPDAAKGTDEWIRGAKPIQMNGLTWLLKEIPPKDQSTVPDSELLPPYIEIWTLRIPETPYWLVMRFSADLKVSLQDHPEEHARLLDLFHQLVTSVKIEPLTPPAH